MVDRIEKFGDSKYRVEEAPGSRDEEERQKGKRDEEKKRKQKEQKSKFAEGVKWSKILPTSSGRTTNPLLAGRAAVKMSPGDTPSLDESEEKSMSVRILKRWKLLDAVGNLRVGILLSYFLAISAIIVSLILLIRITLS